MARASLSRLAASLYLFWSLKSHFHDNRALTRRAAAHFSPKNWYKPVDERENVEHCGDVRVVVARVPLEILESLRARESIITISRNTVISATVSRRDKNRYSPACRAARRPRTCPGRRTGSPAIDSVTVITLTTVLRPCGTNRQRHSSILLIA